MIAVLIFDLDDTLYDEIDYCRSGHRAVADCLSKQFPQHSANQWFDALWSEFMAGNTTTAFNAALERLGVRPLSDLIRELVRVYREHEPNIVLPNNSKIVIERLKPSHRLAMLSDGFLPAQRLKVRALGLEGIFNPVVFTEELGRENWKPSPAGYLRILKELNVRPDNCAYIADNELKDFIAPNILGMTTIKVTRANSIHRSPSPAAEGRPAHVAGDIANLPNLIESL